MKNFVLFGFILFLRVPAFSAQEYVPYTYTAQFLQKLYQLSLNDPDAAKQALRIQPRFLVLLAKEHQTRLKKISSPKKIQEMNLQQGFDQREERNMAYMRALKVCLEETPLWNEDQQLQQERILSSWCQEMRMTVNANQVYAYIRTKGLNINQALKDGDLLEALILEMKEVNFIKNPALDELAVRILERQ